MTNLSQNYIPIIDYDIPQDEQDEVQTIQVMLAILDSFVTDFSAAIELFDFWENNKSGAHSRWPFLAARDGAMTLYHYKMVLGEIRGSFRQAPSLLGQIDIKKLRLACNLFDSKFPRVEKMRTAVAHSAEITSGVLVGKTQESPVGAHIASFYNLHGRKFTTDFGRETLSYEITEASLNQLIKVKTLFFSGFDSVNLLARLE